MAAVARAQVTTEFEALSGQHPPGAPTGWTWGSFAGAAINGDGVISFGARLADQNTNGQGNGLWIGSGGQYALVVRQGDPAPGAGTGATFFSPGVPIVRSFGGASDEVSFVAGVNVSSNTVRSIYSVANRTTFEKVALNGETAPGGTFDLAGTFLLKSLDGRLVFTGNAGGAFAIWDWSAGANVALAARNGDNVPGLSQGTYDIGRLDNIALGGSSNKLAFVAAIDNAPFGATGFQQTVGLFLGPVNGVAPLVLRGDESPITGAVFDNFIGTFDVRFDGFDVNGAGDVAFIASILGEAGHPGVVDASNDAGLFLMSPGKTLLARKGDAVPDSGRGERFGTGSIDPFAEEVVLNNRDGAAFLAKLVDPSFNLRYGICVVDPLGGGPTKVAYEGDRAPGTPVGVTFGSLINPPSGTLYSRLQLNDKGQVVFLAIDSANNLGLWGTDPDGNLLLVARVGDQIQIAPGDSRTITAIDFVGNGGALASGGSDGRPHALNNAGQVVFSVKFADSSSGIVRASLGTAGANTSANHKHSITAKHPVNTRGGELLEGAVDLNLHGPMPLAFTRSYAALVGSDGNITSALGPNWLSNFDEKLIVNGPTVQAVTNEGRVMTFTKAKSTWTLTGPLDIPFELAQSGTNFILADPRSQRMHTFDATGRFTKIDDGHGNTHTLTYNGSGQLTKVEDGLGRALNFAYDANGHLTSAGDGTRTVLYAYDAGGNLVSVTDPLNHTTTYAYAAGTLLTSETLPRGNTPVTHTFNKKQVASEIGHPASGDETTAFSYDTTARTTTITDPLSNTRVHTYTATGELSAFTDEAGKSITLEGDATGRPTSVTDRLGRATQITYHAPSGKIATLTNADGTATKFDYAPRTVAGITFFDVAKITSSDGTSRSFKYDANGNLISVTDELGKKVTFTYDGHGRVLTFTNATGGTATFTYDAGENLASSKDGDTGATSYTYDGFGRLTKLTRPDSTHFDIVYDAADHVTSLTDERGKTYAFSYDNNGNVTAITDPANAMTQLSYDALDRVTQITDRLGKVTSVAFDVRDSLASETDELNHATTIAHDARFRVASVTDPNNAAMTFGYDDEGRLTAVTDPLGHTSTLARNKRGNVIAATDALGYTTELDRDALQRVTKIIDPLGRQTVLNYDKRGQLTGAACDGAGAASYTRDAAGNLTKITDPNHSASSRVYTPAGRVKSSKDPLGKTTIFAYDARGLLSMLTLPDAGTLALERDEVGQVTRLNFSDGTDLHFGHDALGRVISANGVTLERDVEGEITKSTQNGVDFSAAYDDAGRLTSAGNNNGVLVVSYTYDSSNRLTGVSDNLSGASVSFGYDAVGRITTVTRSNGVNATLTYDAADRLVRIQDGGFLDLQYTLNAVGDIVATKFTAPLVPAVAASPVALFKYDAAGQVKNSGFAYDARGRLVSAPSAHTFAWDGASRLTSLDSTTLAYDGLGDVATRTAGGATTRFFYHHAIADHPLVAEFDQTQNQFTRSYVYTPGGALLYAVDPTTHAPSFYHFDRVGSTLALTDAAGNVTDSYSYTPHGELLAHGGTSGASTQPFTFVGAFGVRSEGAYYQMRARYYDPVTGRFLSRDPRGPRLADVRTLDPYLYALGNPTRYVDPDGTSADDIAFFLYLGHAFGVIGEVNGPPVEVDPYYGTRYDAEVKTQVEKPTLPPNEVFTVSAEDARLRASVRQIEDFERSFDIAKQSQLMVSTVGATSVGGASVFVGDAITTSGTPSTTNADQEALRVRATVGLLGMGTPAGGDPFSGAAILLFEEALKADNHRQVEAMVADAAAFEAIDAASYEAIKAQLTSPKPPIVPDKAARAKAKAERKAALAALKVKAEADRKEAVKKEKEKFGVQEK